MGARRTTRLLTITALVVAVALQALPAQAGVTSAATSTATDQRTSTPRLYCGPLLDRVCRVICPHCSVGVRPDWQQLWPPQEFAYLPFDVIWARICSSEGLRSMQRVFRTSE